MKATCALVLFVSLGIATAGAQTGDALRPMDPASAQACDHGRATSPSFRVLAAAFDPDRVVVHVVAAESQMFATSGTTRFVGAAAGWRYVRITIDPDLALNERTAVLAHELQHAREIVEAEANTQGQVRQLYERIGRPVNGVRDAFDTVEAMMVGMRVWRELRASVSSARTRERHDAEAPRLAGIRVQ